MPTIQLAGSSGNVINVDSANNLCIRRGVPHYGTVGGAFAVTGGSSAVVAAALAASTTLASFRHSVSATSTVYITRLRVSISSATSGASGGVPGQIAWQRFTNATPTGGTSRTPARKDSSTGSTTQVADVRDSNAALTVTSVNFGDILVINPIPNFTSGSSVEFVTDLDEDEFIRLTAGDGICLRTQVAGPATMTWVYTYTIHYLEE